MLTFVEKEAKPDDDGVRYNVAPVLHEYDIYTIGDLVTDIANLGVGYGTILILTPGQICPKAYNIVETMRYERGYVFERWDQNANVYNKVISNIEAFEHDGTLQRDYYVVLQIRKKQTAEPNTITLRCDPDEIARRVGGDQNGTEGNVETDSTV